MVGTSRSGLSHRCGWHCAASAVLGTGIWHWVDSTLALRLSGPGRESRAVAPVVATGELPREHKALMAERQDSVGLRILLRMQQRGARARVWSPREFIDLGTRTAVDVALHRLKKKGLIRRIAVGEDGKHGVYGLPRIETDRLLPPDPAAVLAALARRAGIKFLVDEHSAAQQLGLARGATKILFLTNGRLRPIALGNRTLEFRTVSSNQLVWAGRPAADVVQAMRYLRSKLATDSGDAVMRKLREILSDKSGGVIRKDLEKGLGELPIWMVPYVKQLLRR